MTSFVHTTYSNVHPGVARAESVFAAAGPLRRGFSGTKGLSTLLLAAIVAALVVVADQLVDTWADGHLMTAWVILWAVAFAAIALFAGTALDLSAKAVASLDAWSYRVAQRRADERLWDTAQNDPRVMADLQAAIERSEVASPVTAVASKPRVSIREAVQQWRLDAARARADARLWAVAQRDSRVMDDLRAAQTRAESEVEETARALPAETKVLLSADNTSALRDAVYALRPKFAYYA